MANANNFNYKFTPIKKDDIPGMSEHGWASNTAKWKKIFLDLLMSDNEAMLIEGTKGQTTGGLVGTANNAIRRLGFENTLHVFQRQGKAYLVRKDLD